MTSNNIPTCVDVCNVQERSFLVIVQERSFTVIVCSILEETANVIIRNMKEIHD